MIEKEEILTMSDALSLNPDTVEKDYVLSWLLWGINNNNILSQDWLFKGGTSLKKCFFETFRFSEDLDFTVKNPATLSTDFLRNTFNQITDEIYNETGIEFFTEQFKFKVIPKENGNFSAQGTIQYNGPLRRKQAASTPRFASIKLDLTNDEIVVLEPERKRVHHPYSDEPKNGMWSTCYAFEEVIAEKIRALAQRLRPRDLYDVVHFFRNRGIIQNPALVYNVLKKKCSYKKIEVPTYASSQNHEKIEELSAQWINMLEHQLPALPPIESFWQDLEPFFDWLNNSLKERPIVDSHSMDGEIFNPGRISTSILSKIQIIIYRVQFAAANRVCVNMTYTNQRQITKKRIIEPISFRTSKDGNQLLYGYDLESPLKPKSFSLANIQEILITNLPCIEREHPIEINPTGHVVMPPLRRKKS